MKSKGVSPLYLVTNHTNFYERYGWEFLCMVQGDDEIMPVEKVVEIVPMLSAVPEVQEEMAAAVANGEE